MKKYKKAREDSWKVVTGTFSTIVSILIIMAILFSMGNNININDESIKITGISGITIDKQSILRIELLDKMPAIVTKLTNISEGLASKYKLDNGEEAYVYKKNQDQAFIKIICKNDIIYISFNNEKAQQTYNELIEYINES